MATNNNFGGGYGPIIDVQSGNGLQLTTNSIGSCALAGCAGILQRTAGTSSIIANNIINQTGNGIQILSGVNTNISGNNIAGSAVNAIDIGAGVSSFIISGNTLGTDPSFGGANLTAVTVEAGASDYYNIVNNIVHGASSGVVDGGSGTHKTISGNN
jgi:hypothetical protein